MESILLMSNERAYSHNVKKCIWDHCGWTFFVIEMEFHQSRMNIKIMRCFIAFVKSYHGIVECAGQGQWLFEFD